MTLPQNHSANTNARSASTRRGNTIVLVTAILVLLVIIATAFVGRTRAVRDISAAQQASAGRDGRGESVGVDVANEIAGALFAKPIELNPANGAVIDPFLNATRVDSSVTPNIAVASSSWPRLAPAFDAQRYSIDRDIYPPANGVLNPFNGDGFPDVGYNIAPFEVKAWTNWPDYFGVGSAWPFGPGSPQGVTLDGLNNPISDANPYGNPGTGDSRWLRSTEPERIGIDQNGDGSPDFFTFTHWTHLTWLPTANNGWRVVDDIADISGAIPFATDGSYGILDNLNEADFTRPFALALPYEQWLPSVFPNPIANAAQFIARRNTWFFDYVNQYRTANAMPNFFHLSDLGRPTDEFKPGTLRNVVSRTLTDTDGDGFTDSYWFVAPVGIDRGIRTIVGVSVVDNSALLNANVASKFSFDTTVGATPSDLALVTSTLELNNNNTVGFFDGPINRPAQAPTAAPVTATVPSPLPTYWTGNPVTDLVYGGGIPRYNRNGFGDRDGDGNGQIDNPPLSFLQAIGVRTPNGGVDSGSPFTGFPLSDFSLQANPTSTAQIARGNFETARERLAYFKISGLDPDQPLFGLTPFDAADEFELRAFHGNNLPFSISRFEQAVSLYSPIYQGDTANDYQFLRASPMREEADEYLDQLNTRQLLVDNRRKLTLYSGARNETSPPYLWPTPYYEETINYMNPRGNVPLVSDPGYGGFQASNRDEYQRQKQKLDLRRPMFVDANTGGPALLRNAFEASKWRRDLGRMLETSLTKITQNAAGATIYQSIYGTRQADYERTLSMIASYVANIDCASDEAQTLGTSGFAIDRPLYPTPIQQDAQQFFAPFTDAVPDPFTQNQFYLGLEKQPFIMEVFFGLAYPKSNFAELEWTSQGGSPPPPNQEELPPDVDDGGENFVDSTSLPKAVIAVQIANPYDTPISLGDFRLQCFGQTFSFAVGGIAAGYGPNPVLPPATLGKPSTAIVFAVASGPVGGYLTNDFQTAVLDFLDLERGEVTTGGALQQNDLDDDDLIEYAGLYDARGSLESTPIADPLDRTLVFNATANWNVNLNAPGASGSTNSPYTNANAQSVQLLRNITPPAGLSGAPLAIVVDRFDNSVTGDEVNFTEALQRLFNDPQFIPPEKNYVRDPANPSRNFVAGIRIVNNDFYMPWCRASRIWGADNDRLKDLLEQPPTMTPGTGSIDARDLSPRYAFSMATDPVRSTRQFDGVDTNGAPRQNANGYKGDVWKIGQDPDGDASGGGRWASMVFVDMFGRTLRGKPVFFTNQVAIAENGTEVIASNGSDPLPFLPNLATNSPMVRGYQTYQGTNFEWMVGNKGCSMADWARFADVKTMTVPFQMTQKDSDFEQIGEVLDVFMWGHVFRNWGGNPSTERTFSEIMMEEDVDDPFYAGEGLYANRLWTRLPGELGTNDAGSLVIGSRFDPTVTTLPPTPIPGYLPWQPALPAGIAFLDGLTIDGEGRNSFDRNGNSLYDANAVDPAPLSDVALTEERRFSLAHGYLGRKTPGLININTALPEVLQAMPMMTRLTRVGGQTPYSHVVDAIRSYRDRVLFGAPTPALPPPFNVPDYGDRGFLTPHLATGPLSTAFPTAQKLFFPGSRGDRGFASIGELTLLARTPPAGNFQGTRNSYSTRWLGLDPYLGFAGGAFSSYNNGYAWSTDRTNPRPRQLPADIFTSLFPDTVVPIKAHDEPLGDVEDMNLVFKGISNLVTTRSDVFTVYLRVRQVKQNSVTGAWDGTSSENIIDDSRYVMCVDRSEVNSPSDQPKIIYFQKCP